MQILKYSLEALIEAAEGTEIVRDVRTVRSPTYFTNCATKLWLH
jgi:hypothetical protein